MLNGSVGGFALGIFGAVVWSLSIIFATPPMENSVDFFINVVSSLSLLGGLLPLLFICFAVLSFIGLRKLSLATSFFAIIMCLVYIYAKWGQVTFELWSLMAIAVSCFLLMLFQRN